MKARSVRCMKFFLTVFNIVCIYQLARVVATWADTLWDLPPCSEDMVYLTTVLVELFGLILVAICAINLREKRDKPDSALSRGVLSFLLTLGICLVVTAVLGCVGALREHVKILYVHASFFIFLVSIEFLVGVGSAILSAWVGGGNELRVQFYRNATLQDDVVKYHHFWDELQSGNECCGVDGPQDYSILHRDIPPSCCSRAYPLRDGGARRQLHATCLNERTYYARGCEEALRKQKSIKANIFISTGVFFALIEFMCIVLAIWMGRKVRSERRKLQENLQAHFES